mmetsp:Transcript_63450/g.200684  ORF Transcript_63450/g.200684 Transcript_63450/m.200684 type:complete len:284 (-) Transcript_63450:657-1508(-)
MRAPGPISPSTVASFLQLYPSSVETARSRYVRHPLQLLGMPAPVCLWLLNAITRCPEGCSVMMCILEFGLGKRLGLGLVHVLPKSLLMLCTMHPVPLRSSIRSWWLRSSTTVPSSSIEPSISISPWACQLCPLSREMSTPAECLPIHGHVSWSSGGSRQKGRIQCPADVTRSLFAMTLGMPPSEDCEWIVLGTLHSGWSLGPYTPAVRLFGLVRVTTLTSPPGVHVGGCPPAPARKHVVLSVYISHSLSSWSTCSTGLHTAPVLIRSSALGGSHVVPKSLEML